MQLLWLLLLPYFVVGLLLCGKAYRQIKDECIAGRAVGVLELAALAGIFTFWPALLAFELWLWLRYMRYR